MGNGKDYSAFQIEEARNLYEFYGYSMEIINKRLHIPTATLYDWRKKRNWERGKSYAKPQDIYLNLLEMTRTFSERARKDISNIPAYAATLKTLMGAIKLNLEILDELPYIEKLTVIGDFIAYLKKVAPEHVESLTDAQKYYDECMEEIREMKK